METIGRLMKELEIGPAKTFGGLTVYPLLGRREERAEPPYRILDEALRDRSVRITEVEGGGSVPELKLTNDGDRAVLLLDGEELVGAQQNRVLNVTVLAPAGKTIVIPVSCVEAGRWEMTGARHFAAAQHVMYSGARQAKAAQVSASLAANIGYVSDQNAVWEHIGAKSRSMGTASRTDAMRDVFRAQSRSIDEYVRAFPALDDQVGAVFAIGDTLTGVDLFDHADTLKGLLPKVVRSYALDAIEYASSARGHGVASEVAVASFLREIGEAKAESRSGIGLGEDVRLTGPKVVGGALVHDGRVVHLGAFRKQEGQGFGSESAGPASESRARMAPYRQRGRRGRRG